MPMPQAATATEEDEAATITNPQPISTNKEMQFLSQKRRGQRKDRKSEEGKGNYNIKYNNELKNLFSLLIYHHHHHPT